MSMVLIGGIHCVINHKLFTACVQEMFMQMMGIFTINFFAPVFLTSAGVSASTSYISSMAVEYTNFIMLILGVMLVG